MIGRRPNYRDITEGSAIIRGTTGERRLRRVVPGRCQYEATTSGEGRR